jgi:hypothetical protein
MSNEHLKEFVTDVYNGNVTTIRDTFAKVMVEKTAEALETRKMEIAQNYFAARAN